MTSTDDWEEGNAEHLALSLRWLRLRLSQQASTDRSSSGPPDRDARGDDLAPDAEAMDSIQRELSCLAAAMSSPPALVWLGRQLGLTAFEQQLLLLCAAVEFDTGMGTLYAALAGGPGLAQPTFALALQIFDEPAWDALSPTRPLRFWRLIEIVQGTTQPLTTSALRADERIVNFLKGLNHLDDRLAVLLSPLDWIDPGLHLADSQQGVVDSIVRHWTASASCGAVPIIQLLGNDGQCKQIVAAAAGTQIGVRVLHLRCDLLPQNPSEIEWLARLWRRECRLMPLALYVDWEPDASAAQAESHVAVAHQFLGKVNGFTLVAATHPIARLSRECVVLDVTKPTAREQALEWTRAIESLEPLVADQLASQFSLNQLDISRIAREALDLNASADAAHTLPLFGVLWDACQRSARPRLDQLAQRLDARAWWDDLVLPSQETLVLHQITSHVAQRAKVYGGWGFAQSMNRGLGISALFAGDSGTGKTMAAEVIANELKLNLYRIDLSAVVSKYIGETEKNLRRVFDAGDEGGAILFFDEADALFGKRSEVKDSHDRFANIEINYLLQRIEGYRGVAILATNMKSALDAAFLRRLRFIVRFPFPSMTDRRRIWQRAFPAQTPRRQLDFDHLAKLNLTGGSIHSAALNAAFAAAEAGTPVTMTIVLSAIRGEFQKLERPVNETDFRWLEPAKGVA